MMILQSVVFTRVWWLWDSGSVRKIDFQVKDIKKFWYDSGDEYHTKYVIQSNTIQYGA